MSIKMKVNFIGKKALQDYSHRALLFYNQRSIQRTITGAIN